MSNKETPERTAEEAELIMNAGLARALNMPPKPHEAKGAPAGPKPSKSTTEAKRTGS
jgi:hypothetical protein